MAPRRMPPARGRASSGKAQKAKPDQKSASRTKAAQAKRVKSAKPVKKAAAKTAKGKAKIKAKTKLKIDPFKKSAVKKTAQKKGSAKAAKPAAAKTKKAQAPIKDARISATSSRRQNRPVAGRRQATNGRSAAYAQAPDFGAETRDQDTVDTYRGNQRQAPVQDDYVYERDSREQDSATETHPDQLVPGQTGEAHAADTKESPRGTRAVSPQSRNSETESITPGQGEETLAPAPTASSVEHFNTDPGAAPDKKQDD